MPFSHIKIIGKPGQGITVLFGLFFILTFTPSLYAATYYVDATSGQDTNNGLSETTPWKTTAKVNASTFKPGNQILFSGGDLEGNFDSAIIWLQCKSFYRFCL